MTLFEIIWQLMSTQGSNAKQKILEDNEDNDLLREYLKAVYDPAINYYIRKIPNYKTFNTGDISNVIRTGLSPVYLRSVTGAVAKKYVIELFENLSPKDQYLLELIFKRSIGGNVGATMVLKVWPNLFFIPPYMRCSLLDNKVSVKFGKADEFYYQKKFDGAFCYLSNPLEGPPEAITRAGSKYPSQVAAMLVRHVAKGFVLSGELLVRRYGEVLTRQEGNGILNSILKGDDNKTHGPGLTLSYQSWDCITEQEFKDGKSDVQYAWRLNNLRSVAPNNMIVDTKICKSLEEAFDYYQQDLRDGGEGGVIKTLTGIWRDGTSKDCVKLKLRFQMELEVTGYYEGQGKASGMLGGLRLKSSDGELVTDCGSGFDDKTRKNLWAIKDQLLGKIITVEANDISSNKYSNTKGLFLPIFIEVREDKTKADSLQKIINQREAIIKGTI